MICWVCDHPFTHCICSFLLAFFFQFAAAALVQTLIPPLINLGFISHQVHSFGNIISKGWWSPSRHDDSSSTSFSPAVRDSERCHTMQRGWLILTEGTWATVSFSVPSSSLPHFKLALPLFYEEIYSSFSGAAQTVLNEIQFCPSFIRVTDFWGDRLLSIMHFPGEPDPTGYGPETAVQLPLAKSGDYRCDEQRIQKKILLHYYFFFSQYQNQFFSYIMTVLQYYFYLVINDPSTPTA